MARSKSEQLTAVEKQIMDVLWELGEASVREITDVLAGQKQTAYTTVQTMCKIMADKGYLSYRKQGRAFVYRPEISREQARTSAVGQLLSQFFGSSPTLLAEHLLSKDEMATADLDALQQQIDRERARRQGNK